MKPRKKLWRLLTSACSIILLVLLASIGPTASAGGLLPVADFNTSGTLIMVGQSVQFTYTGTPGDGIVEYTWNPGDGTGILNGESPTHSYNTPGQYSISLTVVDVDGDSSTVTKNAFLIVQPFPYRPLPEEEEDHSGLFVFLLVGLIASIVAGVITTFASIVTSYRERRRVALARARRALESTTTAKPASMFVESNTDAPLHQS